ncbi:MAG TPA: Rrf2 family transcriptional regulator [Verrucomicrobiae bacterium]|nr:Rrf2 family transcriptional regulator [Verrucomicrobiae bacterium]
MLTKRTRYGLKALLYLASLGEGAEVSIGEIAEETGSPKKFLEAILKDLKGHRLVESRRGVQGGYRLAKAATAITYADIIRALDGPLALAPCASRTAYRPCDDCEDVKTCKIRPVLLQARDAVAEVLEHSSLQEMLKRGRR